MIKVGVIGYGYWGPNIVRNFSDSKVTTVKAVCDLNASRLGLIASRHPGVAVTSNVADLLNDTEIDALAIATPISTHFDLAMAALKAGKHVLVEKPLADSYDRSRRLVDEAAARKRVLVVDHTFPYTGAVRKMRDLIASGEIGEVYYYDSIRVNLGLFQHDVSVLWDLAAHDLSIIEYLIAERPVAVSATGTSHVKGQPENMAFITLFFNSNMIAHINVNWLAPVKLRTTLIGGSKKMIVYDDLEASEKVKVYDKGVNLETNPENIYQMQVGYRTGDMWAPKLDSTEALKLMVGHFAECVQTGKESITSGQAGARIVSVLESATKSMGRRGEMVKLS